MDSERLTWHEQRALEEIERRFQTEDPDMVSAFHTEQAEGAVPGPMRIALVGLAVTAAIVGLVVAVPLLVFCAMIAAAAVLLVGVPEAVQAGASKRDSPEEDNPGGELPGAVPPV
ncbi:DUF3040 domain-containing protein [Actinokineospora pegani]|uniref:DUF3040 domain-containing protein n=1 Tax=Actinokineospora pegani TaxID=2654637 RepID=UPI0012E9D125|nr:DUF3040 domain-containing protein [Actinokineospora pegani]